MDLKKQLENKFGTNTTSTENLNQKPLPANRQQIIEALALIGKLPEGEANPNQRTTGKAINNKFNPKL